MEITPHTPLAVHYLQYKYVALPSKKSRSITMVSVNFLLILDGTTSFNTRYLIPVVCGI